MHRQMLVCCLGNTWVAVEPFAHPFDNDQRGFSLEAEETNRRSFETRYDGQPVERNREKQRFGETSLPGYATNGKIILIFLLNGVDTSDSV